MPTWWLHRPPYLLSLHGDNRGVSSAQALGSRDEVVPRGSSEPRWISRITVYKAIVSAERFNARGTSLEHLQSQPQGTQIMDSKKDLTHHDQIPIDGQTDRISTSDKVQEFGHREYHGIDTTAVMPGADAAYDAKVAIMNEALIDIGMNSFQWKIFATTGFGWFVDNVGSLPSQGRSDTDTSVKFWLQAITIISPPVKREFAVQRIAFLTVAKYAGLVVGSSLWPMTADYIGRRPAFNITLAISAMGGLVGAGSPNFVAIAACCALIGFGTGGNQPVDSAIFLEYIPATKQNLLTVQSAFWSFGQAIAALIAW